MHFWLVLETRHTPAHLGTWMCKDVFVPGQRVHVVMPVGLLESIDRAKNLGESRGSFVRRTLEQALGEPHRAPLTEGIGTSGENPAAGGVEGASSKPAPAPARAPAGPRVSSAALERQALLNRSKGL